MSQFQKGVLALAIATLVLFAWLGRYTLVVGSRGDGVPPAYKLDRWTGAVIFLFAGQSREVASQRTASDERLGMVSDLVPPARASAPPPWERDWSQFSTEPPQK